VRTGLLLAAIACALVAGVSASTAKQPRDYAAVALNILPPGQSGSLAFPPTATDQAQLYDGLTPLFSNVTTADLPRYFKSEHFGLDGAKPTRTEHPRAGMTILRDRWDVPHVYAKTRFGVEFGAGYATAEDRLLLMQLLRGPGRIAALDVPGVDPFAVAFAVLDAPGQIRLSEDAVQIKRKPALLLPGRPRYAAAGRDVDQQVQADHQDERDREHKELDRGDDGAFSQRVRCGGK